MLLRRNSGLVGVARLLQPRLNARSASNSDLFDAPPSPPSPSPSLRTAVSSTASFRVASPRTFSTRASVTPTPARELTHSRRTDRARRALVQPWFADTPPRLELGSVPTTGGAVSVEEVLQSASGAQRVVRNARLRQILEDFVRTDEAVGGAAHTAREDLRAFSGRQMPSNAAASDAKAATTGSARSAQQAAAALPTAAADGSHVRPSASGTAAFGSDRSVTDSHRLAISSRLVVHREVAASGMEWIDVKAHPTAALDDYRNGIAAFLLDLGAHETLIESTMEPVLLPQAVVTEECIALVVRCAVDGTTHEMDSIQELTNRLTVLFFAERVVTVHRTHMPFINTLRRQWRAHHRDIATPGYMLNVIVKDCSRTFHTAIAASVVLFDKYESMLFAPQRQRATLAREIYHVKRRSSVYSRVLAQTVDAYHVVVDGMKLSRFDAYTQDVEQDMAHARNLADELNDNAQAVLQLLFQLSSFQLNELMRVLTMFSAFFIPLSFVASVFGTNFVALPLIHDPNGHLICFAGMVGVAALLAAWFRLKGFW